MSKYNFSVRFLYCVMAGVVLAISVISPSSAELPGYMQRGLGGAAISYKRVRIKNKLGKDVYLYKESHALVIGASDYTNGWPSLPGVKEDIESVRSALEKKGFDVVTVTNPDAKMLGGAFDSFIGEYGGGENNRLLFYFAGHGYSVKPNYGGEKLGYIVPVDAPNPNGNLDEFRKLAMSMQRMEEYARRINSKHAIFFFDSCFSGSLFSLSRAIPEDIRYSTAKPVRQFITAGNENETVPDVSIFRRMFVTGLDGDADTDKDGYITGSEFGLFMQKFVINYSKGAQHPQYGKIRNPNLDKGDFVFASKYNSYISDAPPSKKNFSLSDLENEANKIEVKSAWKLKLTEMKQGFEQVKNYQDRSIPSELKVAAWQKFGNSFNEDNPYTDEDNSLLKEAKENVEYWKAHREKHVVASKKTGDKLSNSIYMKFVYIPSGTFVMGSDSGKSNEKPVHRVRIDGFYMQTTEVTQEQWKEIMGNEPSYFTDCGDDCPVEQVSWNDIQVFIKKLNKKEGGEKYRLPSESEWEYACRAGSTTEYSYDDESTPGDYAWYTGNSGDTTNPVGEKEPNAWGLYDMSGNVWEWCNDLYGGYTSSSKVNPVGPHGNRGVRVNRGGSWGSYPQYLRSTYRSSAAQGFRFYNIGFRLLRMP